MRISKFNTHVFCPTDFILTLAIGIAILLLTVLIWNDAETTLLMLFMIGIAYPLAGAFMLIIAFLAFRALRENNFRLLLFCGISLVYIAIWTWTSLHGIISYTEFRTSFLMFASFAYSIGCITFALSMLRGSTHRGTKRDDT